MTMSSAELIDSLTKKPTPSRSAERSVRGRDRQYNKSHQRARFSSESELLHKNDACADEVLIASDKRNAAELRIRGGGKVTKATHESRRETFIDLPVSNGDTLTSIALRYNCTIPALKRLNKLMTDQDLFGRQTVRVPVLRHGLVEERFETETERGNWRSVLHSTASADVTNFNGDASSASDTDYEQDDTNSSRESRRPLLRSVDSAGRTNCIKLSNQSTCSNYSGPVPDTRTKASSDRFGRSAERVEFERIFRNIDTDVRNISVAMGADSTTVDEVSFPNDSVERMERRSDGSSLFDFNIRTVVVVVVVIAGVLLMILIAVLRNMNNL